MNCNLHVEVKDLRKVNSSEVTCLLCEQHSAFSGSPIAGVLKYSELLLKPCTAPTFSYGETKPTEII